MRTCFQTSFGQGGSKEAPPSHPLVGPSLVLCSFTTQRTLNSRITHVINFPARNLSEVASFCAAWSQILMKSR